MIEFLLDIFKENKQDDAIIWREQTYSYDWLYQHIQQWKNDLTVHNVARGSVITSKQIFHQMRLLFSWR